jgi:ornithine cyclodeaminase/alanine dehydrogenase-like protein (mu-crystallin family)
VIDGATTIVCDDPMQAMHSGELQYNEWPRIEMNSLKYVIENHESMNLNKGISVFDSTGVSIEDIALAKLIYELSR